MKTMVIRTSMSAGINVNDTVSFRRADSVGGEADSVDGKNGIRKPIRAQYVIRLPNAPSGLVRKFSTRTHECPTARQRVLS